MTFSFKKRGLNQTVGERWRRKEEKWIFQTVTMKGNEENVTDMFEMRANIFTRIALDHRESLVSRRKASSHFRSGTVRLETFSPSGSRFRL